MNKVKQDRQLKKVTSYLKFLKKNGIAFRDSAIYDKFTDIPRKALRKLLSKLVKENKLSVKYEVFNEDNPMESVLYKHKKDIPVNDYAYNPNTGDEFYVDVDDTFDTIYTFKYKKRNAVMNKVVNYIKASRGQYGSFFESDVTNYFSNTNAKDIKKCLAKLVKTGKLSKKYRIYNPDDSSEYRDFSHKDDIPFGGYVDYPATGNHFYVSKYAPRMDIYYCIQGDIK